MQCFCIFIFAIYGDVNTQTYPLKVICKNVLKKAFLKLFFKVVDPNFPKSAYFSPASAVHEHFSCRFLLNLRRKTIPVIFFSFFVRRRKERDVGNDNRL